MLETLGRTAELKTLQEKMLADADIDLKKNPYSPTAIARKSRILSQMGEHKAAVALSTAALSRFTGSTVLLRARCLARVAGNFELPAAQKDCDAALGNDEGDVGSRFARAALGLRLGRWDAAIADCDAALAIERMMPGCIYLRGTARLAKGEKEAAERDLQRARRLDPSVGVQLRRLGLERLSAGSEKAPAA
ncbi:MAG TPA: hypothetical protein VGB70_09860 [Allosphingosinicella sp.]|jgi:tetratricopeptide (TPR) repeat protein